LAESWANWAWRCDWVDCVSTGYSFNRKDGAVNIEKWKNNLSRTNCRGLILLGAVERRGALVVGMREVILSC
jgi:hypothetical protein